MKFQVNPDNSVEAAEDDRPICERCNERKAKYFLQQGRYVCNICYGSEDILHAL